MLRITRSLLLCPLPLVAAEKITYEDHVFPIFEQACLNCHNPDETKGGLDLSNFAGAMRGGSGGKIAEAGDTGSTLISVVLHTSEPKMPPEGDKLSDEHIDLLKAWVEGGLLETRNSKARKPSKPKFDLTMASDPAAKPDGPPPMPEHVTLEPEIVTRRPSAVHAMAASPWAPLLAVTGQRQVLLFHSKDLELAGVLPFPEGDPVSLAFTPNGRYLIVGGGIPGKNGLTVTFDVTNGSRMLTAAKEFDTVLAADLRPDLGTVATGSSSRLVKLWKTEDGSQAASIKKHTDWVTALDFSPDGILLATGGRGGGVWVWEAGSGSEFHTLRGHQAGITATAFRGDSNVLGSASEDGTVRFWEMSSGKEIKKLDAHPGGVLGMAWARDGSLATIGRDKQAKLWKPDFNPLREIKDLPDLPTAVALDAEGTTLFVADYRGVIASFSVENGEPTGEFDANPPAIATRIASLKAELDAHPAKVEAAEKSRTEAHQALEAARQRVAKAKAAVEDARQRHRAAEQQISSTREKDQQLGAKIDLKRKELDQLRAETDRSADFSSSEPSNADRQVSTLEVEIQALDAKRKTFPETIKTAEATRDEANKTIPEAEKRLDEIRKSVQIAEERLQQADAALAAVREERSGIEKRLAHWSAAELNARSIQLSRQFAVLAEENEILTADFADLTQGLETKANELSSKREELQTVTAKLEEADDQTAEELRSVAAALTKVIERMSTGLQQHEQRLEKLRDELDTRLPEADRLRTEAADLKRRYLES